MPSLSDFTSLMRAASEGDIRYVNQLISNGVDINETGGNGATPLMAAVSSQRVDLVKMFLDKGANPHLRTKQSLNALTIASCGSLEILELLVDRKVDPHAYYNDGVFRRGPAIVEAIKCKKTDNVVVLLEKGLEPAKSVRAGIEYVTDSVILELLRKYEYRLLFLPLLQENGLARKLYESNSFALSSLGIQEIEAIGKYSKNEKMLVRNAIFARYNYKFKNIWLSEIYSKHFDGYSPIHQKVNITQLDKKNIAFITNIEREIRKTGSE